MKIGIIGAEFAGLSAALELQKHGHNVTIFEKEIIPGGLAIGFQAADWEWPLEKHYHHIFTSDKAILQLAHDVGVTFRFTRPNTSSLINQEIYQLDSPLKVLQFPLLSIVERLRMGFVLAYLKYVADWKTLKQQTAHTWLLKHLGEKAYRMLWEPLLQAKFGEYKEQISLAWFWARIKARTTQLGYPEGGFQFLADQSAQKVMRNGGQIHYQSSVNEIRTHENTVHIQYSKGTQELEADFDKVIVTLPNVFFEKIAPQLPEDYRKKLLSFQGIGAVNMVLELNQSFFKDHVYWLSICDKSYPFLAVVEHTNFVDKSHYNSRHLLYVGNYLSAQHPYYSLSPEDLLKEYDPYLQKISPGYQQHVEATHVFRVPFAQPIIPINYSQKVLPFTTPLAHVYLANMQQVYPWDRGTNFAVELGQNVAKQCVA